MIYSSRDQGHDDQYPKKDGSKNALFEWLYSQI